MSWRLSGVNNASEMCLLPALIDIEGLRSSSRSWHSPSKGPSIDATLGFYSAKIGLHILEKRKE